MPIEKEPFGRRHFIHALDKRPPTTQKIATVNGEIDQLLDDEAATHTIRHTLVNSYEDLLIAVDSEEVCYPDGSRQTHKVRSSISSLPGAEGRTHSIVCELGTLSGIHAQIDGSEVRDYDQASLIGGAVLHFAVGAAQLAARPSRGISAAFWGEVSRRHAAARAALKGQTINGLAMESTLAAELSAAIEEAPNKISHATWERCFQSEAGAVEIGRRAVMTAGGFEVSCRSVEVATIEVVHKPIAEVAAEQSSHLSMLQAGQPPRLRQSLRPIAVTLRPGFEGAPHDHVLRRYRNESERSATRHDVNDFIKALSTAS